MKHVSDKHCIENQNTHFELSNFVSKNRAVYEIMWKNILDSYRPQITKWRTRFVFWIHKATNIHSEYGIILAFPLQQLLHERASLLRYSYTACLIFPHPFLRFLLCQFDTWGYVNV